ncbi:MAG: glutamate synthase large subunit, partial [Bacteroidota bacterium]
HFSHYFKQLFAQVSNPPIDPIRERVVMSLQTWIGGSKNFLEETPDHCRHIALESPIIDNQDIEKLKEIDVLGFSTKVIPIKFKLGTSLEEELEKLVIEAENALEQKHNILILSDRYLASNELPIPALLALGAVHHHLIRQGKRHLTALVVETGDVREVHHVATLIGFGAVAINPYLVFESLDVLAETEAFLHVGRETLHTNYRKAIDKGMLKVMSKMGISTLQSYHGAQIFEILGLAQPLVERYFKGTVSRMGGMDLVGVQKEVTARYRFARHVAGQKLGRLAEGSRLQWKQKGEYHIYNPESIHLLQKATKTGDYKLFKKYSALINGRDKKIASLRSLLDFVPSEEIPLEEVEPVREILKRFATGAMSFGSISHEAHTALAIAMNKIGGKSNSGEGGEDPVRFPPKPNGDWERSAIKQVASGRFGVSLHYLSEADELQIKIAQGAKPGEGGHLPGYKVDEWIARVRNSTPGVGLISPPPHHDIYSIEDLAQLISDLKNANRFARISVKLVSKAGVGTIASGVAKAFADHILISGYDGGTGAAPLSSIQHAGLPWELGLTETHQTLVHNRLRDRVTLQADGGMKTGRDLAIATLLGAEEWGIATAALIVEGCILTRKCHLNSCPVGIATQDPDLRKRFTGQVGHLIHFFTFLARELREYMAMLGFRTVDAMVGQAQRLKVRDDLAHWKHKSLDLRPILGRKEGETRLYKQVEQKHKLQQILDRDLIASCQPAIQEGKYVHLSYPIANTYRSVGTMLSHEIIRQTEGKCLEPNTINLKFKGSAGQSFGAFAIKGITFELEGEANDYVGKGLSGAQIIVYPHKSVTYSPGENIIIGNVALYGATAGEMFIRGMVGERFAVRNSGASAVVEGLGDHGCEYMTGGRVIVLGKTGKNFAAGMSGGIAYVYDEVGDFEEKVNKEMVIVHDPLDEEDRTCINRLVKRHAALTGSRVATKIIDTWDAELDKIVKVIPTKFKEMQAIQKATQTFVAPTLRS